MRTSVPRPTSVCVRPPKQLQSGADPRASARTITAQKTSSRASAASAAHRASAGTNPTGRIQTIAGSGRQGDCGDNGMAWDLCLNLPHGVAALPGGGFAIADTFNHKLRIVDRHGRMHTAAGPADGLQQPASVQPASGGGLLVTDAGTNKVLRYRHGRLSVVAGNGTKGFTGDGGRATKAELSAPADAVAYRGGVAIADGSNCRIRFVDAAGRMTTIAGSGDPGYCLGAAAAFHAPRPSPPAWPAASISAARSGPAPPGSASPAIWPRWAATSTWST